MMTNILEMLHTTAAYQTAVLQLMVGQANFAAKQLDLKESLPIIIPAEKTNWEVSPPPMGFEGSIATSNYFYEFRKGQLISIQKRDWLQKISPPVNDFSELAGRPSLLDKNSARQLATQWLASVSVNVAEMELKSPPNVFQVPTRKRDSEKIVTGPVFMIDWGEDTISPILRNRLAAMGRTMPRRPGGGSLAFVKILGTTKELLSLEIRDSSLLKRPALQITNASELLGPLPPPRHFVEQMLGGKEAYETVANPDKVEAWLLTSSFGGEEFVAKTNRTSAVKLKPAAAKQFSDILLNFDSYAWGMYKMCIADYGVRLRFARGNDAVEFLLCYECNILAVSHNGQVQAGEMSFDAVHQSLAKAIQSVFPDDEAIKKLSNEK